MRLRGQIAIVLAFDAFYFVGVLELPSLKLESSAGWVNVGKAAARIAIAGTVSRATGGKFANGAAYAAFAVAVEAGNLNDSRDPVFSSGEGGPDFDTEGTAEERLARFNRAKELLGVENAKFDDKYVVATANSDGDIVDTKTFTDSAKADAYAKESLPSGLSRGWVNGETFPQKHYIGIGPFKVKTGESYLIKIYRSGVMGMKGSLSLGGGLAVSPQSAMDNALITLGHEAAHSNGFDWNTTSHNRANIQGLELCKAVGYCRGI